MGNLEDRLEQSERYVQKLRGRSREEYSRISHSRKYAQVHMATLVCMRPLSYA